MKNNTLIGLSLLGLMAGLVGCGGGGSTKEFSQGASLAVPTELADLISDSNVSAFITKLSDADLTPPLQLARRTVNGESQWIVEKNSQGINRDNVGSVDWCFDFTKAISDGVVMSTDIGDAWAKCPGANVVRLGVWTPSPNFAQDEPAITLAKTVVSAAPPKLSITIVTPASNDRTVGALSELTFTWTVTDVPSGATVNTSLKYPAGFTPNNSGSIPQQDNGQYMLMGSMIAEAQPAGLPDGVLVFQVVAECANPASCRPTTENVSITLNTAPENSAEPRCTEADLETNVTTAEVDAHDNIFPGDVAFGRPLNFTIDNTNSCLDGLASNLQYRVVLEGAVAADAIDPTEYTLTPDDSAFTGGTFNNGGQALSFTIDPFTVPTQNGDPTQKLSVESDLDVLAGEDVLVKISRYIKLVP